MQRFPCCYLSLCVYVCVDILRVDDDVEIKFLDFNVVITSCGNENVNHTGQRLRKNHTYTAIILFTWTYASSGPIIVYPLLPSLFRLLFPFKIKIICRTVCTVRTNGVWQIKWFPISAVFDQFFVAFQFALHNTWIFKLLHSIRRLTFQWKLRNTYMSNRKW